MNRKILICTLMMMGLFAVVNPLNKTQSIIAEASVETRAYIYEWRYKVIGDHLYKRLYNATTCEWESDWILVA